MQASKAWRLIAGGAAVLSLAFAGAGGAGATTDAVTTATGAAVNATAPPPAPPITTDPITPPASPPETAAGANVPIEPSAEAVPEVTVEAPEPRYVAPTLRDRIGRIWAPVLINGKGPFRLVLDTGATRSAVIARTADMLRIPLSEQRSLRVRGVTGSAVVPAIRLDSLEVGELLIESTTVPIVADVFGGAEGILGKEGLQDKRIFADFVNDKLIIERSHNQRAPFGYNTIPLKVIRGGLLAASVRVGTVEAKAIIDTGAQRTVGNLALKRELVRRSSPVSTREEIVGVTLDTQIGERMPTPPVAFGGLVIRGGWITFGDVNLFEHWNLTREPVLLIGMDVLGSVSVLIVDYKMRELQIRPRTRSRTVLD